MSKFMQRFLRVSPALVVLLGLGGATMVSQQTAVMASEPLDPHQVSVSQLQSGGSLGPRPNAAIDLYEDEESIEQVTSVSQLSDVQPTDWAFQALQSLVERYGCIAGYPDGTFRGNRAATRYELAAALNACLDNISDRFATREDLDAVRALQEEFATELATLRGRVDSLEARTAALEAQQFSTTTKLLGEAIFTGAYAVDESGIEPDRFFTGYRARLNFDTSFTGRDRLRVRLQARDIANLTNPTGTPMARLGYDGSSGGNFELGKLLYRFPVGSQARFVVDAVGGGFEDNIKTFNPYLESGGNGALSGFGRFNPIYRQGGGGAGVTFSYQFNEVVSAEIAYLADQPGNATAPGGLISGSYAAIAQIGITPSPSVSFGVAYARSFDQATNVGVTSGVGSVLANRPFGNNTATSADHFGLQFTASPASFINLSGWAGYTLARSEVAGDNRKADVLNWAISAQFPDLFREGNLGYVLFGQQPYIINSRNIVALANDNNKEPDPNFHLEAGYRFRVNNNINILPGVIVIFNAENGRLGTNRGSTNDTVIVPVIRTTFSF
ncbi:iron uptake porin [Synechococcales cyanobacterium C]|uniref:Iron uptake porin n=1 Tax=Petrachloros mirabilis ULC683 TaxID=2781853 RepID=A0A8K2ANB4_9CYAN|nr:iron uptake porin [Petrachloros mirabilis]NCJ05268.1 iron uptake porin [Petrachloros mirabilis ULC683]